MTRWTMLAAALLSAATAHCGAETGGLRVERGQHDVLPVEDVNGKTVMPANDHKGLNARWVEAWNARDWTAEAACRTQDYVAHMSGVPVPLELLAGMALPRLFSLPSLTRR